MLLQVYYLYGYSPPLNSQQLIFPCEMKYLELHFFHILTIDAKRREKLVNDILHFFCTLSTRRINCTVHFNYVPSVRARTMYGLEMHLMFCYINEF